MADDFAVRTSHSSSMTVAALISLRETFEASLVVCVILAFLDRIGRKDFLPAVWTGVATGTGVGILTAVILTLGTGYVPESSEEAYEGTILLTAAALLLWMIVWMAGTSHAMKFHIEATAAKHVTTGNVVGIFCISFTAAARESVEMALLVHATLLGTGQPLHTIAGVGMGITGALLCAALLLRGIKIIPLRIFFTATTIALIALGSGLAMHGAAKLFELSSIAHGEAYTLGIGILYATLSIVIWMQRRT